MKLFVPFTLAFVAIFISDGVTGFYVRKLPAAREVKTPNTFARTLYRLEKVRYGPPTFGYVSGMRIINSPQPQFQVAQSRSDEHLRSVILTRAAPPPCTGHNCSSYLEWWNADASKGGNEQILDNPTKIIQSVEAIEPVQVVSLPKEVPSDKAPAFLGQQGFHSNEPLVMEPLPPGQTVHQVHETPLVLHKDPNDLHLPSDHDLSHHSDLHLSNHSEESNSSLIHPDHDKNDTKLEEHKLDEKLEHKDEKNETKPSGTLIVPPSEQAKDDQPKVREISPLATTAPPFFPTLPPLPETSTPFPFPTVPTIPPNSLPSLPTIPSTTLPSLPTIPTTAPPQERFDFQDIKNFFSGSNATTVAPPPPPVPAPPKTRSEQLLIRTEREEVPFVSLPPLKENFNDTDHHLADPNSKFGEDIIMGREELVKPHLHDDIKKANESHVDMVIFAIVPADIKFNESDSRLLEEPYVPPSLFESTLAPQFVEPTVNTTIEPPLNV